MDRGSTGIMSGMLPWRERTAQSNVVSHESPLRAIAHGNTRTVIQCLRQRDSASSGVVILRCWATVSTELSTSVDNRENDA